MCFLIRTVYFTSTFLRNKYIYITFFDGANTCAVRGMLVRASHNASSVRFFLFYRPNFSPHPTFPPSVFFVFYHPTFRVSFFFSFLSHLCEPAMSSNLLSYYNNFTYRARDMARAWEGRPLTMIRTTTYLARWYGSDVIYVFSIM